jgi:hypothetical protein
MQPLGETIRPLAEPPILEVDELWSSLSRKGNVI